MSTKSLVCLGVLVGLGTVTLFTAFYPWNRSEHFKIKRRGKAKKLVKTKKGTYIKRYREKQRLHYQTEKNCYLLLRGSRHVPRLLRFDDSKLEFEIEDGGVTLREFARWPFCTLRLSNWAKQIQEIVNDLEQQGIRYGDWSASNLTVKDGVIKLIDFEQAQLPGGPPRAVVSAISLPAPNQTLRQYLFNLRRKGVAKKRSRTHKTEEKLRPTLET